MILDTINQQRRNVIKVYDCVGWAVCRGSDVGCRFDHWAGAEMEKKNLGIPKIMIKLNVMDGQMDQHTSS